MKEEYGSVHNATPSTDAIVADAEAQKHAHAFDSLKLDTALRDEWSKKYASSPASFFSDEAQSMLSERSVAERLVLLARASLHVVVTPTMARKHFSRFPADALATAALIELHDGRPSDGITHSFFGLVWNIIGEGVENENQTHEMHGGRYAEIAERRERAPRHILSNHREGDLRLRATFGEAAEEYVKAATEAHRLSFEGDVPLDVSKVFTSPAYHALPEEQKSAFLRACLDDMQYALVFDETFNTAFTAKSVAEDNRRAREPRTHENPLVNAILQRIPMHNPAHSMLFGTWQSRATYGLSPEYFDRQMHRTAHIGGAIEEHGYEKLLLSVLREFKKMTAEKEENANLLVEFWIKNRNPIFADATAEAIKAQASRSAANLLLESLRKDQANRSAIAYMLRRVDTGAVVVKNIAEIANLLKDEETPERFFADTMAVLKKSGTLSLEDVQGSSVEMIAGSELRGQLRRLSQMEAILTKTDTEMYPKDFAARLEQQFKGLRDNPNARFYTFEWQGKVASFMSFVDRPPQTMKGALREIYFGFFRTNAEFKGGKIGEALLETALEQEIKRLTDEGKPFYILAYCDPQAPITKKYLELGFTVARSFTTPDGVDRFEIRLDPETYYAKRRGSTP